MSARDWKPGDVAVFTVPGEARVVAIRDNDGEWSGVNERGQLYTERRWDEQHNGRPLVVIDPDDAAQFERVRDYLRDRCDWFGMDEDNTVECLQEAFRSLLTNPAQPEPGLWAVVEATVDGIPRRRWVHHEEGRWVCDTGERRYWEDLVDPVLIRDGVAS